MMRAKIKRYFPKTSITIESSRLIYLFDYTERTKSKRQIEVSHLKPALSSEEIGFKGWESLVFKNKQIMPIGFGFFHNHQFKGWANKDLEHCECCLFPYQVEEDKQWCIFVEIKDCLESKIMIWKNKAKEQLFLTVNYFRSKHILDNKTIYGIISFPRKKTSFNETIVGDIFEQKNIAKTTGIILLATNYIEVIDEFKIQPFH